jgi:hypothetical protein
VPVLKRFLAGPETHFVEPGRIVRIKMRDQPRSRLVRPSG